MKSSIRFIPILICGFTTDVAAQLFAIEDVRTGAGETFGAGGNYAVVSSIGSAAATPSSGGHYQVEDVHLSVVPIPAPKLGIELQGDGRIVLRWDSVPGAGLELERSPTLTGDVWTIVSPRADGSSAEITPSGETGFFRLRRH